MKKLLALSAVAIAFIGCGGNKISDEATKNFENGLNKELKESFAAVNALVYLATGTPVSLKTDGYKCENKSSYISCKNASIDINIDNPNGGGVELDILHVKNISLETNAIYTGNKKGEISIKEALESMPKEVYTKSKIESITVGHVVNSMLAYQSLVNANLSELTKIAGDEYEISSNITGKNITKNGNMQINTRIFGKNNKNEFNVVFDFDVLAKMFDMFEKYGMKYDTENPNSTSSSNKLAGLKAEDYVGTLLLNKLNTNLVIYNDLTSIKNIIDKDLSKAPKPLVDLINTIFENKPHKIAQVFEIKNKFDILQAIADKDSGKYSDEQLEKDIKNINFKINNVDMIQLIKELDSSKL